MEFVCIYFQIENSTAVLLIFLMTLLMYFYVSETKRRTLHIKTEQKRPIEDIQAEQERPREGIQAEQERPREDKETYPAFFATLAVDKVSLGPLDKIKFNLVHTNQGGGYDYQDGIFTVPKKGVYFFSTTVMGTGISVVGIRLATQHGVLTTGFIPKQHGATNTLSAVVALDEGDQVYVDNRNQNPSEEIYGRRHSSFLGYMLQ